MLPTEQEDCEALVKWLIFHPKIRYSHIPQETFTRSWAVKNKNKRMGVCSGVPDYLLIVPARSGPRLMFIEMKRIGTFPSDVSNEQKAWLAELAGVAGVTAVVCRGFDEACAAIIAEEKK